MVTFALNHEIKEVESFFPAWKRYFHFFKTWKTLKKILDKNRFLLLKRMFLFKKSFGGNLAHVLTMETSDH